MNKYVLTADIGKYETNLIGRNLEGTVEDVKQVSLRTKMYDLSEGDIDIEGKSYKIEFNNKSHIIGEMGQDKSYDTSKTNELHQLACYVAITRYLEAETKDNKISMVLACPLSVLRTPIAKEEYKQLIKGNGEIHVVVNNKNYYFEIEDIMLKAEGSGIIFLEQERFLGKNVLVLDLGGLNLGISLYRNKVCKNEDRFIEECGTDKLITFVSEQLTEYRKGNLVDDDTCEAALKNGGLKNAGELDMDSTSYIQKAKHKYFNEVMKQVKKHKIDINTLDEVIFVGGTTHHIKAIITDKIKHSYIPSKPQWCTAKGLYRVAIKKYGK